MHDCSLERNALLVYFSIKLFLDQFFEETVKGEKSLNFAILQISCCTFCLSCLSKSYFIVSFVIFLNAHVSGSNIYKGFWKLVKIVVSKEVWMCTKIKNTLYSKRKTLNISWMLSHHPSHEYSSYLTVSYFSLKFM